MVGLVVQPFRDLGEDCPRSIRPSVLRICNPSNDEVLLYWCRFQGLSGKVEGWKDLTGYSPLLAKPRRLGTFRGLTAVWHPAGREIRPHRSKDTALPRTCVLILEHSISFSTVLLA